MTTIRALSIALCSLGGALVGAGCGGGARQAEPIRDVRASAPHDPCDGTELSLGEAASHCRTEATAVSPPSPDAVAVEISTRTLRSGSSGVLDVVFRNATAEPIELDFAGTLQFDASLLHEGRRVDERWEVSGLAGGVVQCRPGTDCRTVRVRLAPGGTLTASLPMSARTTVVRDGPRPGTVARSDGGAIPPGEYDVQVVLPWFDPVAASTTGARTPRVVRGTIAITR